MTHRNHADEIAYVLLTDARDKIKALEAALATAREDAIEHACAVIDAFSEYDQNECCDGRECGCRGSAVHDHMKHMILALINKEPKT